MAETGINQPPDTLVFTNSYRLDQQYADQEHERRIKIFLGQGAETGPEGRKELGTGEQEVGTAAQNLEAGGEAADQLAAQPVRTPLESASEEVRARVTALQAEGPVRKGVDAVLRTITGAGIEEIEQAVRTGTLPDKLSMKLLDPAGSTVEAMVRAQGEKEGLDPELNAKVASGAGLLLGMLFPGGKGAGKSKAAGNVAKSGKTAFEMLAMAAKEGEEVAPEIAMRLNLERVAAGESVKATMSEFNRFAGEWLAQHRKVKTHAQTLAESQGRGAMTLKRALSLEPETVLLDEADSSGLRDLFNATAEFYDTLKRRAAGGEALPPGQLKTTFLMGVKLAQLDEANGRNIARGLEIRKVLSESQRVASRTSPEQFAKAGEQFADIAAMSDQELLLRSEMLTARQQMNWIKQTGMMLAYGRDLTHTLWIQNLLTNPVTHAANLSGGLSMLTEAPERLVGEMANFIFREPGGMQVGETAAALRALRVAVGDGFRLAGQAAKTGLPPFEDISKVEIPRLTAEAYGFASDTGLGRFMDVMGAAVQSPWNPGGLATRGLITEDALMKGIAYRMELSALAYRTAKRENLHGRAFDRRVAALEAEPTGQMILEAQQTAIRLTLNTELGQAGQFFTQWINRVPGGRVVVPFIRWGTNAAKWTWQRTPILAEVSAQNWRDLAGTDPVARDRAIGRIVVGHAAAYAIAYEVAQGNITGGSVRRKGNLPFNECPPYSVKSGGQCYPYLRMSGQVGQMIAAIANYSELRRDMPDHPAWEERWRANGEAMAIGAGEVFIDQTAMQGLKNVLDGITDPDRSSKKFLSGLARSVVPAGVRAVTRISDDQIVREVHSLNDAFRSGLPWTVAGIPPRRNQITGEEAHYPSGLGPDIVSPIFFTAKKDSIVFKEIRENMRTPPAPVPWHVGGDMPDEASVVQKKVPGVELTPWERDFWITAMTQKVRLDGRTLYDALEHEMRQGSRYWEMSKGPGGSRESRIKSIYAHFRDKGEQLLRDPVQGSPNLEDAIRKQQELRIRQALPTTNPRSLQYKGGVLERRFMIR